MGKAIRVNKKRRGRPKTTGPGKLVGMRWHRAELAAIDAWAKQNAATRSEAIRRLVELGLAAGRPTRRSSPHATAKAREIATEQVERLMSPLLPEQERRARTRRLIKGPREFREMRVPKPKS